MRRLFGSTGTVLRRRWAELERLAMVTLYRDQFADDPGPCVSLALGERTTYRAGAWLVDTFERAGPDLGGAYTPPSGSSALVLVATGVEAADSDGAALHARALPRDQWAAVEIAALDVGVLLRGDEDGYRVTASATATTLARAGTELAATPTGWRPGEVLRAEVLWNRVRVYRNAILVLDVEDATAPGSGRRAGILVNGSGRVGAWAGGALRQEYLAAVLDMGDVRTVLGEPVRFDLAISNLAPMGGAERFAALLRHGLNTSGTYDLARGAVRVYSALGGAEVPVLVGSGLIEGPVDLAEDRARIAVRGRDGFLTPKLDPGPVTYLPGPPPGTTPAPDPPDDPCAPSPDPLVIPGDPDPEPDADDEADDEGTGPEAPDKNATPPGDGGGGGDVPVDGGGVGIISYGRAYWGSTGHLADPGNNPVTDSETDSEITRIPVLVAEYLTSWQNAVGINNVGADTWTERFAVFYVTRTPTVAGTHLRILLSLGVSAVSLGGVDVGFGGTDEDPDAWETADDIRHAEPASIGVPVPAIPHPVPSASWGPVLLEMAVGAVRTIRLFLSAGPGPLTAGDYALGEATLTIQDAEFFTPPPDEAP